MSFLTDLFHGNFNKLGTDLSHDPWGTAAAAIPLAIAAPFVLPELGAALGIGGTAAGLGAEAGAAGLGAGVEAGAFGAGAAGLAGSAGTDILLGGAGADVLAGGAASGLGDVAAGGAAGLSSALGAAAPAAGAAAPGIGTSLLSWASANPGFLASLGVGGLGTLLAPQLSGMINKVPQQGQLTQLAGQEATLAGQQQQLGTTLTQPLLTGQLPAGAQSSVDQAFQDAIKTTKARYASLGLSGSTMEADAIAAQTKQKEQATFDIANQMAQTGMTATGQAATAMGLQDQVYAQLMNAQVQQDTALQQAIARLAAGAALGSGTSSATKTAAQAANVFGA